MKIFQNFKELREYYSFYRYCLWGGPATKADWIYENRIKPLEKKHPVLSFIAMMV